MKYKLITVLLAAVIVAVLLTCIIPVSAKSSYLSSFNQHYDTENADLDSCALCHSGPNGGSLNPYGRAYSGSRTNIAAIEDIDSDGDGFTNIEEIDALTFPGNPDDYPVVLVEALDNTSEVVINTTEIIANDSEVTQYMENESSQEEDVENIQEQEDTEEPEDESTSTQRSPGFETYIAIAGIIAVAYLKRK